MNKKQFITHYIATFLASYMASRYDSDCQNGHPNEPYNNQPVEDATFLAEKAWEQYYNPYEIGLVAFRDGKGISDLPRELETDDDLILAMNGWNRAKEIQDGFY